MRYRKKPIVIEATQWFKNGDHPQDGGERFQSGEFAGELLEGRVVRYYRHPGVPGDRPCEQCGRDHNEHGWIDTLEQGHRVCPGDWIITGVKGERYPCKPDIFAATYEGFTPEHDDRHDRGELASRRGSRGGSAMTAPAPDTVGDALPREMARVRDEIMPLYQQIGQAGLPGLFMMRAELDAAAKALAEGDVVDMIRSLEALRGWKA